MQSGDNGENTIYDHRGQPEAPMQAPIIDTEYMEAVSAHLTKTLGTPSPEIMHEIVSHYVHLDVLTVPNCLGKGSTALVTCGMGCRAMNTPPDMKRYARMELAICLPPGWPPLAAGSPMTMTVPNLNAADSAHGLGPGAWIVSSLTFLARLPFRYDTWLGEGHTIPNGEPPEPICRGTRLCGEMITKPKRLGEDFHRMVAPDGGEVYFWTVTFLTAEEMEYKLRMGAEALMEKLAAQRVNEQIQLGRLSTCPKGPMGRFEHL